MFYLSFDFGLVISNATAYPLSICGKTEKDCLTDKELDELLEYS
jgi:hypothetical protein